MTKDELMVLARKASHAQLIAEVCGMRGRPEKIEDQIDQQANYKFLQDSWIKAEQEYRNAFDQYYEQEKTNASIC